MTSSLRALVDIINKNIEILEKTCEANGTAIPDLNAPFHPASEAFRADPGVAEAANVTIAAAHQLAAILTPPPVALYHVVGGFIKSAALRVCLEGNVTEILREAGPAGLHVDDIARLNGLDAKKLSRFLRILAVHHIYREVTPDVFTNTRISSMLDTMKPSGAVISHPEDKHKGTMGLAALASHHLDETFKASSYLWESSSEPSTALSGDPTSSAFARAMGAKETLWQYYDKPEQGFRQERFGIAMSGVNTLQSADFILKAFDWSRLQTGSVVVDVGGGIGSVTHIIVKNFPNLRFVVQDTSSVIKNAKNWWTSNLPEAIDSGTVTLQAHDFFAPQPQKEVVVFMLRMILHDWSDEYCLKILKQLRAAATPLTKLLVLDSIMPYGCHDPSGADGIPGSLPPKEAPAPLLANYGAANEMVYLSDIAMCIMLNSQERTIRHFDGLLNEAGWKLVLVNRQPGDSTHLQALEAIPF
ncbi:S-adenosyl-L-methionine-dependent methyltransferase [Mycena floridula]|nr:S-adenosyl-L-methionine-dependent methyltransferase [Mycena floridula]